MSKLTFRGGIKRRKIDEFRSEVFAVHHHRCAGADCGGWPDGCAALIYAEGESSPSRFAMVTSPAKIFCQNVNFSFFVIDVMLLAS